MMRAVHPEHVHALRAELAPRFEGLFGARLQGSREDERRALLASWEEWRERDPGWLEAPEDLSHGRQLEARLRRLASEHRAFATGFTLPSEVAGYHHLWDEYVRGAAQACQQVSSRATAAGNDVDAKAYEARSKALLIGWTAADILTPAEELLSGGDLLKLYIKTVHLARDYLALVKRDWPDVPRPTLPTGVLQAEIMGELDAAGLIAHGSTEVIGETVSETATQIAAAARDNLPKTIAIAAGIVGGALILRSLAK